MSANSWLNFPHHTRPFLSLPLVALLLCFATEAEAQATIFPTTPLSPIGAVSAMAVGDFNGDGQPDLAYISPPQIVSGVPTPYPTVVVRLNQGPANPPTSVVTSSLSCTAGSSLVAADMNNDQKTDLVLTCSEGYVVVLLGNGDGTFQTPAYYPVSTSVSNNLITLAPPVDLNGDGYLDIVISSSSTSILSVLLNQGSGSPGALATPKSYTGPTGVNFTSLGIGDFNGDGKQDVLAGPLVGSAPLIVFLGNGDGTFQTPQTTTSGGIFVTGYFNLDGLTDVAYVAIDPTTSAQTLQVLLCNSSGQLTTGSSLPLPTASAYTAMVPIGSALGTDRSFDFALIGDNTSIVMGDENGGFTLGPSFAITGSPAVNQSSTPGVVNLVVATSGVGLTMLTGGGGTFVGVPNSPLNLSTGFILADVNGDGFPDVLSLSSSNGGNFVTALNRGNGTFTITSQIATTGSVPLAGDFNGDGNTDAVMLVTFHEDFSKHAQLLFYSGNGNGTFQPAPAAVDLGFVGVESAVVGDFNGDKNLDIVLFSDGVPDSQPPEYFSSPGKVTAPLPTRSWLRNYFRQVPTSVFWSPT